MNQRAVLSHPVISFSGGLIAGAAIIAVICFLLALMSFNLGGGESLMTISSQYTGFTVAAAVFAMCGSFVAKRLTAKGKQFKAYGVCVSLILFLIATVTAQVNFQRHEPLVSTEWKHADRKPFHMAVTLIEERKLPYSLTKTGLFRKNEKGQFY